MIQTILSIFRIQELRSKILFTLGMLLVFRVGTQITVPGINSIIAANASKEFAGGFLGMVDLFSGGALSNMSIFTLGIMPYISSSIIMQLFMVLIPSLQKLQKEGEEGRKKINQYTKIGTLFLCIFQSYYMVSQFQGREAQYPGLISPNVGGFFVPLAILTITTGTILLLWMGEQITERGIGNGVSLIIFAGIVGRMPKAVIQLFTVDNPEPLSILILFIIFILLIFFTIYLTQGVRKVPLQYGKQMVGRRMVQAKSQSLPFKVNGANVMPIIFASSLILFPQTIFQSLSSSGSQWAGWVILLDYLNPFSTIWYHSIVHHMIYTGLIIFFAYFYTSIQFNPQELSENLKKYGGYIPGIRAGSDTKVYIEKVLNRITLPGSIFLAALALSPYLIIRFLDLGTSSGGGALVYTFGGTSLLIMVGVALDTLKQIEAQLVMRNQSGFMKKSKIKGR